MTRRLHDAAFWTILCTYLFTVPLLEIAHDDPAFMPPGCVPELSGHIAQFHCCLICAQISGSVSTLAISYHLCPPSLVFLVVVPMYAGRPAFPVYPIRDKRGPPLAYA